jgi:chromosome segregation ATPase
MINIMSNEYPKRSDDYALATIENLQQEKSSLNHELEIFKEANRIIERNNEKLDQEVKKLQEALEIVNSDAKVQIEGRDAALRGSMETFKGLNQKIEILEENLTRSDLDRLSQLTMIMRMIQALGETPQDKRDGAIYLIKRVVYEQICRLDPSQSL